MYNNTMTVAEHKSDFKLKKDTPYMALMGEMWGVCYEDFGENWSCFNGTALYRDWELGTMLPWQAQMHIQRFKIIDLLMGLWGPRDMIFLGPSVLGMGPIIDVFIH